jgi:hypothetical protein
MRRRSASGALFLFIHIMRAGGRHEQLYPPHTQPFPALLPRVAPGGSTVLLLARVVQRQAVLEDVGAPVRKGVADPAGVCHVLSPTAGAGVFPSWSEGTKPWDCWCGAGSRAQRAGPEGAGPAARAMGQAWPPAGGAGRLQIATKHIAKMMIRLYACSQCVL